MDSDISRSQDVSKGPPGPSGRPPGPSGRPPGPSGLPPGAQGPPQSMTGAPATTSSTCQSSIPEGSSVEERHVSCLPAATTTTATANATASIANAEAEILEAASLALPLYHPQVLPPAPSIDLASGRDCTCVLLHIHHSGIPAVLRRLLESDSLHKVGLNITGDAHKLKADFGLTLGGVVELQSLANQRQLVHVDLVTTVEETRRWSLSGERRPSCGAKSLR